MFVRLWYFCVFLCAATWAQASTVSITFSGSVGGGAGLPYTNFYPLGTPISGRLDLDVDDGTNAPSISDFRATVGLTHFSMSPGGSGTVNVFDNAPPLGGPISADGFTAFTSDLNGPSLFGITASVMRFRLLDFTRNAFDTDTPSAADYLALNLAPISVSGLAIFFVDSLGDSAGSIELFNSDLVFEVTTDAVAPVPLPASGLILGFAILALPVLGRITSAVPGNPLTAS